MCNLYRVKKERDEVAEWFDAIEDHKRNSEIDEMFPGAPGMVVVDGVLQQMTWGFPLVMKGKNGQPLKPKPVNNARTDKLDTAFWRPSFEQRRCLIPVSGWAEAQGAKGSMTRTWMSLPDQDLFACAGLWRESDEWGASYSMVMTDSAGSAAADVHSRMPVLLRPEDYAGWIGGSPDGARSLCKAWEGQLRIDHTQELWAGGLPAQPSLF